MCADPDGKRRQRAEEEKYVGQRWVASGEPARLLRRTGRTATRPSSCRGRLACRVGCIDSSPATAKQPATLFHAHIVSTSPLTDAPVESSGWTVPVYSTDRTRLAKTLKNPLQPVPSMFVTHCYPINNNRIKESESSGLCSVFRANSRTKPLAVKATLALLVHYRRLLVYYSRTEEFTEGACGCLRAEWLARQGRMEVTRSER